MAEHAVGNQVVLTGTIVEIDGGIALVRVDRAFPAGGTVTVRLGKLPDDAPSQEERIREAMKVARENPGRTVTVEE
jgi:hypothetical protein